MTDRIFADCCYGGKYQHRDDEECPFAFIDRGEPPKGELERAAWELEPYFSEDEKARGIPMDAAQRVFAGLAKARGEA